MMMDFQKIQKHYKKISHVRQPDDFTVEEWQYALRKQYAEMCNFSIENKGLGFVYSDYAVYNPGSRLTYKVAIRSKDNSANFCECNDFKTNGLGTCKHIEAVFHYIDTTLNKKHLLDFDYQAPYSSIYLDYRGTRTVRIRIGTDNAGQYEKLASRYFDSSKALKPGCAAMFDQIIAEASDINQGFRCYPDAMSFVIDTRENTRRAALVAATYEGTTNAGAWGSLVRATLYPYQKEGVCFAASRGRCIIADDMGLGKSIQAIAAAELLKKECGISSVFIICPTSLKYQWKTEIEKFTGTEACVVEGTFNRRLEQYENAFFYKILSYNTAVNDIKNINATLPDLFILDEAQRIKNFKTKISNNIKQLRSPYTFVLTGTPLENKLDELYSIVQFADSYALGPYWKFIHDHRILDTKGKVTGYKNLNSVGQTLANIMIRRRKKDVLPQLPERVDKILFVPMTEEQVIIHDEYKHGVAQCIQKWQRHGTLSEKDRQQLMINLNFMRMVCDSTYLIDQETRYDTKIDELMNILDELFAQEAGKVVVFSQWERMTRLVARELDTRGIGYQYLHGGVPSTERGKLLEGFDNDPHSRVFLSTDAGGVGLNLQAASLLINLDIPWNPAVLEQRIARIYRLGQKRNVSIINMVSTGTIEHKMLGVLTFKKGLSEGILDGGDDMVFMEESKFKMFMQTVASVLEKPVETQQPEQGEETDSRPEKESKIGEAPGGHGHATQTQLSLFEDVDLLPGDDTNKVDKDKSANPEELMNLGMQFFTQLEATLTNPEATQKLVQKLVQKDETDGKTYLKIPVENQQVVEHAFRLFAGLIHACTQR